MKFKILPDSLFFNLSLPVALCVLGLVFAGCGGGNSRPDLDSPQKGTIHISVDESFRPVIDSQIQVYMALHPDTKIIAEYKPEAECFKDLMKDSTRMIIVTRGLSDKEEKFYNEKFYFYPSWQKIANDAVAVIVNKASKDSVFYIGDLKSMLKGTSADNTKFVFDGLSGSSSLRFIKDSILRGEDFDTAHVFAEKNSEGVINYVEHNKNVIGFVGVSWIGNPEDTTQLSFLTKINIAAIQCTCPEKSFVKPYQANIVTKRYPLVRGLYYILKENYNGLGSGFANFLQDERGQKIFWRAYLAPAKMNLQIRTATLN
ncbi:MAG: substrate-binding domain-containing protein [Bacteroidetes bacterium]|nr:substrate-binding domain-containing protein [Bacteroidota bacterium]